MCEGGGPSVQAVRVTVCSFSNLLATPGRQELKESPPSAALQHAFEKVRIEWTALCATSSTIGDADTGAGAGAVAGAGGPSRGRAIKANTDALTVELSAYLTQFITRLLTRRVGDGGARVRNLAGASVQRYRYSLVGFTRPKGFATSDVAGLVQVQQAVRTLCKAVMRRAFPTRAALSEKRGGASLSPSLQATGGLSAGGDWVFSEFCVVHCGRTRVCGMTSKGSQGFHSSSQSAPSPAPMLYA